MKSLYLLLTIAVLAIFMAPHADASEIYSRDWVGDKYDSIYGDYDDPDKIQGTPWICLSPNSTDTGIAIYRFVPPFEFPGLYKYTVSVYGYDNSSARVKTQFGLLDFTSMSGEIVYLGRGLSSHPALVSGSVTSSLERFLSSKKEIWVVIQSTPAQEGHIKSVELEIEYDCYPPETPGAPYVVPVNISVCSSQEFYLQWFTVPEATMYRLYENGALLYEGSNFKTNPFTRPAGTYVYTVSAGNEYGWSAQGEEYLSEILPVAGAVEHIYLPSSDQCDSQPFEISWSSATDAVSYRFRICENNPPTSVCEGDLTLDTTAEVSLPPGKYHFRVQPFHSSGCPGEDSPWDSLTIISIPATPTPLVPVDGATDMSQPVTLDWLDVADAERYHLQIDDNPSFTSPLINSREIYSSIYFASGMDNDTKYYWRLGSLNDCGASSSSEVRSFTTCGVPATPVLLSPNSSATVTQPFTMTWSTVSNADEYHMQFSKTPDFNPVFWDHFGSSASYLAFGFEDITAYYWRVRAGNECGWGDFSLDRVFITDCPAPDPPILVQPDDGATNVSQPVTWDWSNVMWATKYHIQVDNDNSDFNSLVVDDSDRVASDFTWDGLANVTGYWWRVRSGNDCGNWGDWSDYRYFTTNCPEPDPPTLELPANCAVDVSQPITWDWNDVAGANTYHIQVDNDNTDFKSLVVDNDGRISSDFTWDGLTDETRFYWRVKSGNDCGWSAWSAPREFITDCPVPNPPTLELPTDGAIDVSQPVTWDWSDVSEATKYHIQVDNDSSDFNSLVVDNDSRIASDFTWGGLDDATDYWWRVRSGNDCGWSDWSLVFPFSVGEQTDVREIASNELPSEFTLSQNYPNPFNPVTNIDFALPCAAHVRVEVFNILGNRVSILVDEHLSAGYKSVEWDGRSSSGRVASSGVYLFRITAGEFSASCKALLMK